MTKASKYDEPLRRYINGERAALLAREMGVSEQSFHATRRRRGIPAQNQHSGEGHWNWKGGRHITSAGYIKIRVPDNHLIVNERDKDGYVFEHRVIMSDYLERSLAHFETVHHKDGNHSNNRLSNLQLRIGAHGPGVVLCCAACGSNNLRALEL